MALFFITGGARSGKSFYAQDRAHQWSDEHGLPVTYVATATAGDPEMVDRIARHQATRPTHWATVEEPEDPVRILGSLTTPTIVIVDCLSLLLSNWMLREPSDAWLLERQSELVAALETFGPPVFVVSNEVGQGIVPMNALARRYRDQLGLFNQRVAKAADRVIWMVSGLPVDVRASAPQW